MKVTPRRNVTFQNQTWRCDCRPKARVDASLHLKNPVALDRRHGAGWPAAFVVEAPSDPGLLIRILAPFARRDTEIDRLACRTEDSILRVEAFVRDMPKEAIRQVAGSIRQIVGVVRLDVETECAAAMLFSNEPAPARLCA